MIPPLTFLLSIFLSISLLLSLLPFSWFPKYPLLSHSPSFSSLPSVHPSLSLPVPLSSCPSLSLSPSHLLPLSPCPPLTSSLSPSDCPTHPPFFCLPDYHYTLSPPLSFSLPLSLSLSLTHTHTLSLSPNEHHVNAL